MAGGLSRRDLVRLTALGLGSIALPLARLAPTVADSIYIEVFPTSPLVINPFSDPLPIPGALAPVPRSAVDAWAIRPGPGAGQQSAASGTHQLWPSALGYPDPLVYRLKLQVGQHSFTSSPVLPIDANGRPTVSFDAAGKLYPAGATRTLPPSTIYGYNGKLDQPVRFLGTRINAEYGKPCLVRFENDLAANPLGLDRQDFGSPERDGLGFLTHLHNGHTAPESDGNPHYRPEGYLAGQWVDNLYLNWEAGGDDREKQSFFWFHDHRMDHTGSNVYKGMVGLYPIYDPKGDLDNGDETKGLRLPGVRHDNGDGSFAVA